MTNTCTLFNNSWEFAKTDLEVENWHHLTFEPVEIPHDWLIYDSEKLYENSIGWYRTRLFHEASHGARLFLRFDGVYMDSTLYCNGQCAGEWKYGYTSFEHELTPFLHEGANEIILKVVYQAPNSRWYTGAGIFRNVWLIQRGKTYIPTNGIYIHTNYDRDRWFINMETELHLDGVVTLKHSLSFGQKKIAERSETLAPVPTLPLFTNVQTIDIPHPLLWSPQNPCLYSLETNVLDPKGNCIETIKNPVGFRRLVFDPDHGLLVNDVPTKIHGTCEHHDLGALGSAFNREAQRYRLLLLKNMGVNAIRSSHNMPDPQLMGLADELGFFIISEAFDMWERPKTPYDYARFFPEWFQKDIASWIRRDRNHPSLLLWSIGNEIYDTHVSKRGLELTRLLMNEVRKHDPEKNASITIASNYMPWENTQRCVDILKYAGYNYGEKYYQSHHQMHPDWIIYGSETSSVVQSRGVYHFPYERTILTEEDQQCSALGNSPTSWGARSPELCIAADRDTPFSAGMFIWTGFDYIGEPTPYHTKNSYFGQIDTAGFPKDSYYIYQAAWTDYKKNPMIQVFPYWDWNPGQLIDVRVCTNAPKMALYCNGRLIGTKEVNHHQGSEQTGWWKIPFEPGELMAIAYDEEERCIAQSIRRSFGDPNHFVLRASKPCIEAKGQDMVFLEIGVVDASGNLVENASNRVIVTVRGAGRLVGLDNGDSTDYDSYKGISKRLFNGKLMALIGATTGGGPISVTVGSPDLPSENLELAAVPTYTPKPKSASMVTQNKALPIRTGQKNEIPLRKIEICLLSGSQTLSPASARTELEARLLPANTSYPDVTWSVVNDVGIPSPLASLEVHGLRVLVHPHGDGNFRVRCGSKNGTTTIRLISQLEFTASGFGFLYKNPYQFISAGLYDDSNEGIGPGNEQGIATARDMTTIVGYRDIDFGIHGSDTITIPIFTLSDDEYQFQIWQGYPERENSLLLGNLTYQKKSIWNVYQEETYRLHRRFRLVQSVYFVTHAKMHIKGFIFKKQNRSFAKIMTAEYDVLYGDKYRITDWGIRDIGNNVTITFEDFNFKQRLPQQLSIYGRSLTNRNSITLMISAHKTEQVRFLLEFEHSEQDVEKRFPLPAFPEGLQVKELQISFIFLPGSSFDFGWFQFQ